MFDQNPQAKNRNYRNPNGTCDNDKHQINGSLAKIEPHEQVIVAYEPVWAIGTGLTPDENEIKETHLYIKTKLNQHFNTDIPILYGGSANSENCSQIISIDNVGGLLVGGASLKKHDFKAICNC